MPLLIDSAPACVKSAAAVGNSSPDAADTADYIVQAPYADCAGFMTFGPGSTYGPDGLAAATSYYVLTGIGFAFMVIVLIYWCVFENRRLLGFVSRLGSGRAALAPSPVAHEADPNVTPYNP